MNIKFKYENGETLRVIDDEIQQPERVSREAVLKIVKYLKSRGYKMVVWSRIDYPEWQLKINQWSFYARTHKEAWCFLIPFYRDELKTEYDEYREKKAEKIRQEMRDLRNKSEVSKG